MKYIYQHTCDKCDFYYISIQDEIKCGKPFPTPLDQQRHTAQYPSHVSYSFKRLNNSML